jgi:hypothetical protein
MSIRTSLTTLAAAGVLAASMASAAAACPGWGATTDPGREAAAATAERPVLEGQVAAIDYASGQLILETDEGFVALQASPDEVSDLHVGDLVTVALEEVDPDTRLP